MRENMQRPETETDGVIEGRNAVAEALRSGTALSTSCTSPRGRRTGPSARLAAEARADGGGGGGGGPAEAGRHEPHPQPPGGHRRGGRAQPYADGGGHPPGIAEARGERPLLVVCDEISDPHNLGAIIRTAECAGAHGVIVPKRRSAGLTAVVAKSSAGAVSYLPVARVPNIAALLADLKKRGIWVFGAAAEGSVPLYGADLARAPPPSSSAARGTA